MQKLRRKPPRGFFLSETFVVLLYASFKIFLSSFDALWPRRGPYFLPLQKVGKDRRKGVSPPCESPDQSGVLDAPLWKPPSLRCAIRIGRTPRRLRGWSFGAVGESRERMRARHGRRTSTASGWGLRPLTPQGSQTGTFADHARQRMVPRPKRLLRQRLRKSARKLLPRKRLGVPSLPSRELRPKAAPARQRKL